MKHHAFFILFGLTLGSWGGSWAQDAMNDEVTRLSGFKEHKQDIKAFDQERERGRVAYDEFSEQMELQKQQDLKEYRKQQKKQIEPELTDDFQLYVQQRRQRQAEHEALEKEYAKSKKRIQARRNKELVSEAEELDLLVAGQRVDYKKRVLYGAHPNFKGMRTTNARGGKSGSSEPTVAPPPAHQPMPFDDFGDPGFIPPPPPPPDFDPGGDFNVPPPPPPPMPPDFDGGDFPPPPPPPPPDFGDF